MTILRQVEPGRRVRRPRWVGCSRPSWMGHTCRMRAPIARSWVATTTAAPVSSATWTSTSATWSAVARSSWLVGSSARIDLRAGGEHPGDHDPLRLATGQFLRQVVAQPVEVEQGKGGAGPVAGLGGGVVGEQQGQLDVLAHREAGDQARGLEHQPDRAGVARLAGQRGPAILARRSGFPGRLAGAAGSTCRTRTGRSSRSGRPARRRRWRRRRRPPLLPAAVSAADVGAADQRAVCGLRAVDTGARWRPEPSRG